jgi:hypothetical protein
MMLIDKTSVGHMIAVNASGKVAAYHVFLGGALILTLPLAYLFVKMGLGVYSVGVAMVITMAVCAWGRVWFARRLVGMSGWYWIKKVFCPLALLIGVVVFWGGLVRVALIESFARVLVTTVVVELVFVVFSWFFVLDENEREWMMSKIKSFKGKVSGRVL